MGEAPQSCVLVSGGVDSAVLVAQYPGDGRLTQPVYVRTGMVWEAVEMDWLGRYLAAIASPRLLPLQVLDFPLGDIYGSHWSVPGATQPAPAYESADEEVYLPGRNIILLAKTAVYCALNGIESIASGVLAGNPFPDATDEFFGSYARTLSLGLDTPVRIERPFDRLHKSDVVRMGARLPLDLTFSCIRPSGELHCGSCNKCAERQRGFAEAGIADLTRYAKLPSGSTL